jgi:p-cumate 2,3-dioxygenase ferredoxin subunit
MGTMTLQKVCDFDAVAEGSIIRVEVDGLPPLAVYKLDGEVYVTDDTCTHGDASLADGEIEDACVVCPYHMGAFDIKTGEPTAAPCTEALKVYAVTVQDGAVLIEV